MPPNDGRRELPPIEWGSYLIEALNSVGFVRQGMNGPVAVEFREIEAWINVTGQVLTPWEAETVRNLSETYVAQSHNSANARADAPYWPVPNQGAIDDKFKQLAARKRKTPHG